MKKIFSLTFAALVLFAGISHAFNKDKFVIHFKKAFNLDSKIPVTVGDPTPSPFGGLLTFPVSVGGQNQTVYLTKDEKQYFWGSVYDLSVDPDVERASKINLQNAHSKGPKTAPITIVEFSDLQCPNCKLAHAAVDEKLYKDFSKDQIRVFFKHFPLGMHEWAEPAAVATECAAAQKGDDAFWPMIDLIYQSTDTTLPNVREKVIKYASELKLDKKKFKACLDDPKILEKVQADKKEGMSVGVNATPSFFVNGRLIRGNRYEDVKSVITEKLAETTPKK